uniref:O-antigen ligase family protein n=1 Tax=uncultured Clostridium sp. TaxID=59620 RepID=UPI0026374645
VFEKPITGWGMLGMLQHGSNFVYSDQPELYNKIITFLVHPHNLWLTFLVTLGIVGLVIYLYIKFNLYKDMINLYKKHNKMLPLIAAMNTMVVVQGMVDCTLYAPQLGATFVCMGAITYNMANDKMIKKVRFTKDDKKNCDKKDMVI